MLNRILLRYGVRRLEAQVRDLLARHVEFDNVMRHGSLPRMTYLICWHWRLKSHANTSGGTGEICSA
jgi:hypothetical protein